MYGTHPQDLPFAISNGIYKYFWLLLEKDLREGGIRNANKHNLIHRGIIPRKKLNSKIEKTGKTASWGEVGVST